MTVDNTPLAGDAHPPQATLAVSVRTPKVRSILGSSDGGFARRNWPLDGFAQHPAISKFHFDLVASRDIDLDTILLSAFSDFLQLRFQARIVNDDYLFSVTGVELPSDMVYGNFQINGVTGCFDSAPQPGMEGKIAVFQGFRVDYAQRNFHGNIHHLCAQVDTLPGTNQPIFWICHANVTNNDPYNVRIDYAFVDEDFVFGFDEFSNTKIGGGLDDSVVYDRPTNTVAIINGFDLEFLQGHRGIQEILVEVNQDGRLFVNFKDQTNNDSYRWKVNVAYWRRTLNCCSDGSFKM